MRATVIALSFVCCGAPERPAPPPEATPITSGTPRLPAGRAGTWRETLCEPSALIWSPQGWIVGDNEVERGLYLLDDAMQPTRRLPLSPDAQQRVDDIEALTADLVVGSHSRTRKEQGRDEKPDRFKVLVRSTGVARSLDLTSAPGDDVARLRSAQEVSPVRSLSGLDPFNIEGAAVVGQELWLGLRGPLDADRRAMVLVTALPSATQDLSVRRVLHLDLGGEGIRELTPWRDGLLVVSGPADADAAPPEGPQAAPPRQHNLWWWPSAETPPTRLAATLPASTEGAWPIDPAHLLVVIDGRKAASGDTARCETPGGWAVVDVALP